MSIIYRGIKEYWEEATPMKFDAEKWSYEKKRAFRYGLQDYMHEMFCFEDWKGKKVLEVGSGSGIDVVEFARHGARVTAIDITDNAIALTRALADEAGVVITAVKAPATRIPYREETFDCVYSFGTLHHIPDVEKALAEMHRVLKVGGTIMAMLYHKDSLLYVYSIAYLHGRKREREKFLPFGSFHDSELLARYSERIEGCPYTRAYTKDEARELFEGWFTDVSIKVCYNVIDVVEERKVKLGIDDKYELGWHLIIKGRKA